MPVSERCPIGPAGNTVPLIMSAELLTLFSIGSIDA